jgi:hypothetical protein
LGRFSKPVSRSAAHVCHDHAWQQSGPCHGIQAGDWLVFGSESKGLPPEVRAQFPNEQRLRLPMLASQRSLNLSNAVAVTVFEAWRQQGFAGLPLQSPRRLFVPLIVSIFGTISCATRGFSRLDRPKVRLMDLQPTDDIRQDCRPDVPKGRIMKYANRLAIVATLAMSAAAARCRL